MKGNFSKNSTEKLFAHAKGVYKEKYEDSWFSSYSGFFSSVNFFIWVLFFINIFFNIVLLIGTLLASENNDTLQMMLSGYGVSLFLILVGIIIYKFKSKMVGAGFMAVSLIFKYFSVYNGENSNPFNFSVMAFGTSAVATVKSKFFMHFLPMVIMFALLIIMIIMSVIERATLKGLFNKMCDIVYTLKPSGQVGFTSEEEWDNCVDKYISGEYKNHKKKNN